MNYFVLAIYRYLREPERGNPGLNLNALFIN